MLKGSKVYCCNKSSLCLNINTLCSLQTCGCLFCTIKRTNALFMKETEGQVAFILCHRCLFCFAAHNSVYFVPASKLNSDVAILWFLFSEKLHCGSIWWKKMYCSPCSYYIPCILVSLSLNFLLYKNVNDKTRLSVPKGNKHIQDLLVLIFCTEVLQNIYK